MPLICFTLLSPASVGVVLGALVTGEAGSIWCALLALVLVSIGMAGSVLHLARPLMAPTSLRNVASSCLSREIVVVSAYWAVVLAWCACCLLMPMRAVLVWVLCICAMAMGCVLVAAIGNAYLLASQPAWNGREVHVELAGVALGVGGPAAAGAGMLQALVQGSVAESFPVAVATSAVFALAGLVLSSSARAARAKRVAELADAERDAGAFARNPRVLEAHERIRALDARYRMVRILCIAGVVLSVAPPLSALVELAAHGLARDAFYRLRVISRYAVRLHRW